MGVGPGGREVRKGKGDERGESGFAQTFTFTGLARLSAERRGGLGMSRCCMSIRTPSSFIHPVLGSG